LGAKDESSVKQARLERKSEGARCRNMAKVPRTAKLAAAHKFLSKIAVLAVLATSHKARKLAWNKAPDSL
jgi:hypothetical protein